MEGYSVEAGGYLQRARERIGDSKPESVFYAALELRCYVEARQNTYLAAQQQYVRSLPPAWKIGHQWKALKSVMSASKIQYLQFRFENGSALNAYYVPVSEDLRNGAERMSALIHAQSDAHRLDDPWWDQTRGDILKIYRLAWLCERGNMICPAMISGNRAIGSLGIALNPGNDSDMAALRAMQKEEVFVVKVQYLQSHPPDWIPDA